jgi:LAS superfamily LD-carboxypeptidase LdcB
MRPDVGEAFDRMAAAARKDGITLIITSVYRSDATHNLLKLHRHSLAGAAA